MESAHHLSRLKVFWKTFEHHTIGLMNKSQNFFSHKLLLPPQWPNVTTNMALTYKIAKDGAHQLYLEEVLKVKYPQTTPTV